MCHLNKDTNPISLCLFNKLKVHINRTKVLWFTMSMNTIINHYCPSYAYLPSLKGWVDAWQCKQLFYLYINYWSCWWCKQFSYITCNIWHRNVPWTNIWNLPEHHPTLTVARTGDQYTTLLSELLPLSHSFFLYERVMSLSWMASMRTSVCSTDRSVATHLRYVRWKV